MAGNYVFGVLFFSDKSISKSKEKGKLSGMGNMQINKETNK